MLFAGDNSNVAPWFILDVLLVQPSFGLVRDEVGSLLWNITRELLIRIPVNTSHLADLAASIFDVSLVNADCINPEEKSPSHGPHGRSSGSLKPLLGFDEPWCLD